MSHQEPWIGLVMILITMLIFAGLVWLIRVGVRRLLRTWRGERLARRMAAPVSGRVTAVFWIVFIVGMAALFFGRSPTHPIPVQDDPNVFLWLKRVSLPLALAVTCIPMLRRWSHGRTVTGRALKRAEAGDVEGAIREVRQEINARGPTAGRSHALARLMMLKENWIDARKLLLEAEDLSDDRLSYRGDMAVTLRNLGRVDDALAVIESLVNSPRASIESVRIASDLLIDLGRLDAACDRIAQAETLFKELTSSTPLLARLERPRLDATRRRLEAKLAAMNVGNGNGSAAP